MPCYESAVAVDGYYPAIFAWDLHNAADGAVRTAVVSRQVALRAQAPAPGQLCRGDAGGDVVANPHADQIVRPAWRGDVARLRTIANLTCGYRILQFY